MDTGDAIIEAFCDEDGGDNAMSALLLIGRALRDLGNGNAATNMGAIEAHGKAVLDGSERIAGALTEVAAAIDRLAEAVADR